MITKEHKTNMRSASMMFNYHNRIEVMRHNSNMNYVRDAGLVYRGSVLSVYSTGGREGRGLNYWVEDNYGNGFLSPNLQCSLAVALAVAKAWDFYTESEFRSVCWGGSKMLSEMVKALRKLDHDPMNERNLITPALRYIREKSGLK